MTVVQEVSKDGSYHKLTRGNETKVPNRPTHLENFQYSGWYSTQQFSNRYMKLSLRSALEFNAIEGIFICRRKTEQVSVGIYYPSESFAYDMLLARNAKLRIILYSR